MPAILEPPTETPVKIAPISPTDAVANLVKGNRDLLAKETATPNPELPKPDAKAPEPKATSEPTPKPDGDFDFENPDPAKPPKNKKHWDGFLAAREQGFKKREEESANLKKELESVRGQISELQKQASTPRNDAELEALKKERDELKAQIFMVARERSPEFIAQYETPVKQKASEIKMVAGDELGEKIVKLINSPDSEWRTNGLKEALAEVDDMDRPIVRQAWFEIEKLRKAKQAELATAEQDFQKTVQTREQEAKAQRQKEIAEQRKNIDALLTTVIEKRGLKISNQERLAIAKQILYGEVSPERVVEAVLNDADYAEMKERADLAIKDRDTFKTENEKLLAQIESLTKASPAIRQPSSKIPGAAKQPIAATTSPQNAFRAYVQSVKSDE